MTSARKKKIKTLLSRMNKQNQRFIIIAPPLFQAVQFLPAAKNKKAVINAAKCIDCGQSPISV